MSEPVRILVADPTASVRTILHELLSRAGVEVTCCAACQELEEAAGRGPYDAVISDVQMGPDRTDRTLLRLRTQQPGLPILILSELTHLDADLELATTGIFLKPFPDLVEVARFAIGYARSYTRATLAAAD